MREQTYVKEIISYIESHITDEKINYGELAGRVGYSAAHVRELFAGSMGYPLAKYIKMRKIKHSAVDLMNSVQNIAEIAYKYGFSCPETYTRSFRKVTGMSPSEFRSARPSVGKEELISGVYGIGIFIRKDYRKNMEKREITKNNGSTILYGVSKVGYGVYGGCTPYPICLKACAEYLGEDLGYEYTMVTSAAAFRLAWNNDFWDLGNVDIYHTVTESNAVYGLGAKALGREFEILEREQNTTKEEFKEFIKRHIDEGYPCMALGIIGPPEACIITGYREDGDVLLGWNFFQEWMSCDKDECGYFVTRDWWNEETQAVMCLGAIESEKASTDNIIRTAITALEGREEGSFSKGINAYDAWEKFLHREEDFRSDSDDMVNTQYDAMDCLLDGRKNAAIYFRGLAKNDAEKREQYNDIAKHFDEVAETINQMWQVTGGRSENSVENFKKPEVRKKVCELIKQAKQADEKALELMKGLK